jgi:hypothetical protein
MAKTRDQKIFGAAVLKVSFQLRDAVGSPAFQTIYPGVLRDLELTESEVDRFIEANRPAVETAARGEHP